MDAVHFIQQTLAQAQFRLRATCNGLDDAQARWRPAPEANCVGFILWHLARTEDNLASGEQGLDTLWAGDGWHARFGNDVDAPAVLADRQSALALDIPPLPLLLDYQAAAAERTRALLATLTAGDLDQPSRSWPAMQLADVLRHLATHKNNHHGQIDFLRGLQQDDWDLPPGTGVRLPDDA